jgi:uncharacterized protein involved in outer membrane biogenesis
MKRLLIILTSVFLTLLLVLIIAIHVLLTEDKIRELAIKPIEESTSYKIDFKSFEAGLWGGFHAELGDIVVQDTLYKKYESLAKIGVVRVDVKLFPLLSGSLEIDDISLSDASIFIEVPKQELLKKDTASIDETVSAVTDTTQQAESSKLDLASYRLALPAMSLTNVSVETWIEESNLTVGVVGIKSTTRFGLQENQIEIVSDLSIDSLGINLDGTVFSSTDQSVHLVVNGHLEKMQFSLDGTSFVFAAVPGEVTGNLDLSGTHPAANIAVQGENIHVAKIVENLKLDLSTYFKKLNGQVAYTVTIDLADGKQNVNYKFETSGFDVVLVEQDAHISKIDGKIFGDLSKATIETFDVIAEQQKFNLVGHLLLNPVLSLDLKSKLNVDLTKLSKFNRYLPSGFHLYSGKLSAELAIYGTVLDEKLPSIKGFFNASNVKIEVDDLPEGKMTLNGRVDLSDKSILLKKFTYKSQLTDVFAELAVRNYLNLIKEDKSTVFVTGSINSNTINVTPYLSDSTEQAQADPITISDSVKHVNKVTQANSKKMALGLLTKLDLKVDASIKTLIIKKIKATQIKAQVRNTTNLFTASLANVNIFSGAVLGKVNVNYKQPTVALTTDVQFKNMNLRTLSLEILDIENTLYGNISATGDMAFDMPNLDSINMKTVVGKFKYDVRDGKLANVPALKKLASTISILDFDTLRASTWQGEITIKDETVFFPKITLDAGDALLVGRNGKFFFNGKIDFPLALTLSKSKTTEYSKQAGNVIAGLLDVLKDKEGRAMLRATATGKYNSPVIKLDWTHAEKKVKEQAGKKIKEEAKKLLKKWF